MATESMHLSKAPIVEAIIAFDFVTAPGDLEGLRESFFKQIKSEYPTQAPIKRAQVNFDANGSTGETSIVGSRCLSSDGKNVCAISESSFLCSRLQPYSDWESLRTEFRRLWEIFNSLGKVQIRKAAVRYINKIFIPSGSEIFDSIYTYPKLADGLPDAVYASFIRLEIAIPEPGGTLIVTEGVLPPERPNFVAIALDHDLQFPITEKAGDVWELLEKARELKNQYFFASISPEVLKEYL
jgi:uncharacterized protein (TIGR04255 family)